MKAIVINATQHQGDPATSTTVTVIIEFRIAGASPDPGVLYASVTLTSTDTAATAFMSIQNAVIAKAAEYGITITSADIISLVLGVPQSLMSPTTSATLTASDDGVNQTFTGSLGALKFDAAVGPTLEITDVGFSCIGIDFGAGTVTRIGAVPVFGPLDLFFQGITGDPAAWTVLEGYGGAGVIISTGNGAQPISIRPNRVEVGYFDSTGLTTAAGVQVKSVAKQIYTTTNHSDDRSYNETSTTLTEIAHVLGTLIGDLRTIGLVA